MWFCLAWSLSWCLYPLLTVGGLGTGGRCIVLVHFHVACPKQKPNAAPRTAVPYLSQANCCQSRVSGFERRALGVCQIVVVLCTIRDVWEVREERLLFSVWPVIHASKCWTTSHCIVALFSCCSLLFLLLLSSHFFFRAACLNYSRSSKVHYLKIRILNWFTKLLFNLTFLCFTAYFSNYSWKEIWDKYHVM